MPGIICHELFTIFTFCFLQSPSPLLPSQRRSSHVPLPSRSVCTGVWLSEDVWGGGSFVRSGTMRKLQAVWKEIVRFDATHLFLLNSWHPVIYSVLPFTSNRNIASQ